MRWFLFCQGAFAAIDQAEILTCNTKLTIWSKLVVQKVKSQCVDAA